MKSVLISTAYLPPISWLAVALQSGSIEIEVNETYPKQTFRNRCEIATSSGILSLTVPVIKTNGNHTITGDIGIDNSKNWQIMHWRSIITAYNKSPYFLYYRDLLEPIFIIKHESLVELNRKTLDLILKALKIRTLDISNTEQYQFETASLDFRNHFQPKIKNHETIPFKFTRYMQVFELKHGFIPDLSVIDLLFNLGPDAAFYLANTELSFPE